MLDPRVLVASYGVEGLRVADASLMPYITTGNTHAPALMIGARVADLMLSNTR